MKLVIFGEHLNMISSCTLAIFINNFSSKEEPSKVVNLFPLMGVLIFQYMKNDMLLGINLFYVVQIS